MSSPLELVDDDLIVERMDQIRNVSEFHVASLHREAARMGDWREHVRAKPLTSFTVAVLAGFTLLHKASAASRRTPLVQSSKLDAASMPSLPSGLVSFVGSLAGNVAKNYVLSYVKSQLSGGLHDRANASEKHKRERFEESST